MRKSRRQLTPSKEGDRVEENEDQQERQTVNVSIRKFGPWFALVVMVVMAWGSPAVALDDAWDGDEEPVSLPELDEDHPLYWAQMREIYVMQQRAFLKEGRLATTLYGGIIPNNIFEQYYPVGLRINYYVMENVGLELSGSYAFSRRPSVNDIVEDHPLVTAGDQAGTILIGDTQLSHTTLGIKWSPVYGKFSLFDSRLFYFDMYAFAGAGVVVTQTEPSPGDLGTTAKPEGAFGAGVAIYAGQHVGVRFDYRQFVFQKVNPPGGVANPSEASMGLTWFF